VSEPGRIEPQAWDAIVAAGWGPIFAASNVIEYLRRDEDAEGSIEVARRYYRELYALAAKPPRGNADAGCVIARLELTLTKEERALLRAGRESK